MLRLQWIVLVTAWCVVCTAAQSQDVSVDELTKQVLDAYDKLDTYESTGTITSDIDSGGMKVSMETTFAILLKKPNQYLIRWKQKNLAMPNFPGMPNMEQVGAIWRDGNQPYLLMGGMANQYTPMKSDEMAIASATGISGGAAFTIPSLFLKAMANYPIPFARLKDPKIVGSEAIADDPCYVLRGPSDVSVEESFWISKKSHLIRQYRRSLKAPEGSAPFPEMTEDQLEAAIEAMGQEVNEESIAQMRNMMEMAKSFVGAEVEGYSTETHSVISTPKLNDKDFEFEIPPGTPLKESLLPGP